MLRVIPMIKQTDFFGKYRIGKEEYKATRLEWDALIGIHNDYLNELSNLEPTAKYVVDCLQQIDVVHSMKFRLKDSEHLIEKIIRKKINNPSIDINIENYKSVVTDLIGIRALHLFKEDWTKIHDFITEKWELCEKPIANVRKGDPESHINELVDKGCEIREHEFGYRSVHYLVRSQPTKVLHIVEIQVRTIFEEAWSEIDHRIRYPYDTDNPMLNQYLFVFNRLAGSADEMGSFVRFLKNGLEDIVRKSKEALDEKDKAISELREQIKHLKIEKKEKDRLEAQLEEISRASSVTYGTTLNPSILNSGYLSGASNLGLSIAPQTCSRCGKEIKDSFLNITYPPLCSDCRYTTAFVSQKCSRCGKDIDSLSIQVGPPLCSNCRTSGFIIAK